MEALAVSGLVKRYRNGVEALKGIEPVHAIAANAAATRAEGSATTAANLVNDAQNGS